MHQAVFQTGPDRGQGIVSSRVPASVVAEPESGPARHELGRPAVAALLGACVLLGGAQRVPGVAAYGGQLPEQGGAARPLLRGLDQQRPVHQRVQQMGHLTGLYWSTSPYGGCGGPVGRTGQYRQAPVQDLLGFAQQPVSGVDGVAQQQPVGPPAPPQPPQPAGILDHLGPDLGQCGGPHPGRRELDRQR